MKRLWEEVKHVGGKMLKWGLIGAVVIGGLLAIAPIAVGGSLTTLVAGIVGVVSPSAAMHVAAFGASKIFAAAVPGLILGGAAGAAVGLATGVAGAGEAADERIATDYDNQQRAMDLKRMQLSLANAQQNRNMAMAGPDSGITFSKNLERSRG